MHPIDTRRCTVRTGGAFASRLRAGIPHRIGQWLSWGAGADGLFDFLSEDKAIRGRVQRGVSGTFVPGGLVPLERVVEDFGHYLNSRLNDVEPPDALVERCAAIEATGQCSAAEGRLMDVFACPRLPLPRAAWLMLECTAAADREGKR